MTTAVPGAPEKVSPAVVARGLVVRRGRTTVFDGLDLEIPAGRLTGLLGPSGSGKTTLIRAIVGVQRLTAGTVSVLGEPAGSRSLRRRVSYDSQAASVYDDLTVAQNFEYFASVLGASRADVAQVLDDVGLQDQGRQLVGSLSGGQRGRVSLGVAMLGAPDLLVLDEPTVGLDPLLRETLWGIFRSLADAGATLLVSSHVMDEALRCDEVVLLREGQVLSHTTPERFLAAAGTTDPDAAFLALVRSAGSEEVAS